ncbi:MAG: response regulator [Candidatus Sericytochromatia bacterium]|nr:response regulator [Candidatus Sericytochromatia bacterium]
MTATAGRPTIVLVEDDPRQTRGLATSLERAGFRTCIFRAAAGLEVWLADHVADLLLLDAELPGESGPAAHVRLRAEGLLDEATPVLIVSGYMETPDVVAAYDAGVWDVIVKPIDPRILVAKCRAILVRTGRLPPASPAAHHQE